MAARQAAIGKLCLQGYLGGMSHLCPLWWGIVAPAADWIGSYRLVDRLHAEQVTTVAPHGDFFPDLLKKVDRKLRMPSASFSPSLEISQESITWLSGCPRFVMFDIPDDPGIPILDTRPGIRFGRIFTDFKMLVFFNPGNSPALNCFHGRR